MGSQEHSATPLSPSRERAPVRSPENPTQPAVRRSDQCLIQLRGRFARSEAVEAALRGELAPRYRLVVHARSSTMLRNVTPRARITAKPSRSQVGQALETVTIITTSPVVAAWTNASARAANTTPASPVTCVLIGLTSDRNPCASRARVSASIAGVRCFCRKG